MNGDGSGVTLHAIDPAGVDLAEAMAGVSDDERARAARLVFQEDRERWLKYRAALRRILGARLGVEPRELPLSLGEHGKPYVPGGGIDFNLSHSDRLAVVIVSCTGVVGVDIEPVSRGNSLLGCEAHFCHPREIEELSIDPQKRADELIHLWTAKEAGLKAMGTGMSQPPQEIRVTGDRWWGPLEGLDRLRLSRPPIPGNSDHVIAVACEIDSPPPMWAE
ncbi:MAG: 4'-phosphopantetheinyl transferase superfamily protein [Akkermansiaceae bacterium]|nr:4'-phosphopantetheinyl transferase superfamily protein [Akkermansiaceae bacterium]